MLILTFPRFSVSCAVTGEQLQPPSLGETRHWGKEGEWPGVQCVNHKLGEGAPPSQLAFKTTGTSSPVQSRGCWKGEDGLEDVWFPAPE